MRKDCSVEKNRRMIKVYKVFMFSDDQSSFSSSSSLSSFQSNKSRSVAASVKKLMKVPDGIWRDCVCHRSNDKNQTVDAI